MPEAVQQGGSAESLVALRGVSKRSGLVQVLHEIDLDLARGEIVAVLGPAGCGKSTLCRAVNGLERIDSGTITMEGQPLRSRRRALSRRLSRVGADIAGIGPVVQSFSLFAHRTVLQNVTLGQSWIRRLAASDAERRALALLERVGMAEHAARYPWELSDGLQQRVAIARALVSGPKLMVFDEPAVSPVPSPADDVTKVLRSLAAEGMATLVATRDAAFARSTADRVVFMAGGRIIEQGPPDEFFTRPRTARAKDFLAGGQNR
ncbi:glutamate transport system ATP-binding protein [Streptacidiphilus sp. MAP12-16]|uniref:amino acid ABC transporter ATP-binding protein n=1 Tax=Streptacidiphilus sp. MAP12-16 TaxID=3156300 RepID=UPI003515DC11